jgi:hypothetical protein
MDAERSMYSKVLVGSAHGDPTLVCLGGVGAGDVLGVGSSILTPDAFLLTSLHILFGVGGVAVALCLLARVVEDPTLWPLDESSTHSALGVRAKTEIIGIEVSPSSLGMGPMKLAKVCRCT